MAIKKVKSTEAPAAESSIAAVEAVIETPVAETKKKVVKTKKSTEKKVASTSSEPNVYIEFNGKQVLVKDVIAQVTAAYKAAHKRTAINTMDIYLKPDESAAYYVINEKADGEKIDL